MTRRLHGRISLGLLFVAVALAAYAIFVSSPARAAGYVLFAAGSAMLVVGVFCTKCPEQGVRCAHGVPGMLAERFLRRRTGPYTGWDYAAVALAAVVILLLPQAWLVVRPGLFLVFWILVAAAAIEIRTCVCLACGNACCPLARR
ncbi:MAG: hypothetical protein APR53_03500 [Methanoculleus sp. SDB]|nr:MAG: hypothetical protein APR53_03500 [Methanoculleus sp. SDB]